MSNGGWRETTLGDCATLVRNTVSPSECGNAPYVGLEHIGEGTLSLLDHGVASDVTSTKAQYHSGDILFGKLRPYFRKVIRPRFDGICSTDIWVVQPIGDVDPGYLFYLMASQQFVDFATAGSEGKKMPRAKWEHVSRYPVPLPPLDEQRRIARILGTLDDKIELNRRMSETLEAMAQALFKSWFVDFDPVRAKAEGRPTGLPPDLDALFPDSFQDSELGKIPEGWRVGLLGDIAKTVRGRSYRSAELAESDTALVTLKSFARGGGYRPEGLKPYTGKYKPEQVIEPGELVIACTDVTQAAEVVGRPALVLPDQRFTTLVASLDTMILRPHDIDATPVSYLYGLTSSPAFASHTYAHVTGTTVLHLQKDAVPEFRFPISPIEVIEAFGNLASTTASRAAETAVESERLSLHRDNLLQHLISNENGGAGR